ncbi:hypothetical protein ABC347_01715 [Sphingomonas sp. 1P06PA]|uniref:hypothetical protein n=1 Tax=Sphingomonas sp. 1P06PA TaxID=554121 RepID=UPI0039A69A98
MPATLQQVETQLAALNYYTELAQWTYLCHDPDLRKRRTHDLRIDKLKARVIAVFPTINLDAGRGKTDYSCRRSDRTTPISRDFHQMIGRQIDRLAKQVEALLPPLK